MVRRCCRVLGLLLLCALDPCVTAAAASGVNLAWGTCMPTGANVNQDFACASDDAGGPFKLVMSCRSPVAIPDFVGAEMLVDVCNASSDLPDWWMFDATECRSGGLVFPAATSGAGAGCTDVWAGLSPGGGFVTDPRSCGGRMGARLRMEVATLGPAAIAAGDLVIAGVAAIDQSHTVSGGSGGSGCAGCAAPVCIVLNAITLFGYGAGETVTISAPDVRQYVTWQASGGIAACPASVPTRNTTWGAIKAIYR